MEAKPLQLLIPDQVKHLLRETPKVLLELLLRYLTLSYYLMMLLLEVTLRSSSRGLRIIILWSSHRDHPAVILRDIEERYRLFLRL